MGILSRPQPHGRPPLTDWDTCTGLSRLYDALRTLDPYHVTVGALDAGATDAWSFSDATGAMSVDVALVENYATSLDEHRGRIDHAIRRWPMDTSAIVNCLWTTGSWQSGIYTPRQLRSTTWTGAVTASMYHQLYFALFEGTDEELVSAAMLTSRELHETSPALLSAGHEPEIAVGVDVIPVAGVPIHISNGKTVPVDPDSVVARAWSETPAVGAADPYCVWLVAVNTGSTWTANHGSGVVVGQLVNLTLTGVGHLGMPFTHGNWQFSATTPFEAAPDRSVPVLGTGSTRFIVDWIAAGETAVYQLGCGTLPNDPLPLAARAPTGECGLLNPSFEHFAIAG